MRNNEYGLFPMFFDISEKQVVVIGAGRIASRRIRTLSEFTPNITVIADRTEESVRQMEEEGLIRLSVRKYEREDLYGADIVIAATDNEKVNDEIHSVCKCLGILVNVISDKRKCDFHFPGIVKKDNLVVGVNAGGKDHKLARHTREKIQSMVGGAK